MAAKKRVPPKGKGDGSSQRAETQRQTASKPVKKKPGGSRSAQTKAEKTRLAALTAEQTQNIGNFSYATYEDGAIGAGGSGTVYNMATADLTDRDANKYTGQNYNYYMRMAGGNPQKARSMFMQSYGGVVRGYDAAPWTAAEARPGTWPDEGMASAGGYRGVGNAGTINYPSFSAYAVDPLQRRVIMTAAGRAWDDFRAGTIKPNVSWSQFANRPADKRKKGKR